MPRLPPASTAVDGVWTTALAPRFEVACLTNVVMRAGTMVTADPAEGAFTALWSSALEDCEIRTGPSAPGRPGVG